LHENLSANDLLWTGHTLHYAPDSAEWLRAVLGTNDWTLLPADLTWQAALPFAYLIDGYDVANKLDLDDGRALFYSRWRHAQEHGEWLGSAVELWLCLFASGRSASFGGIDESDIPVLDKLCRTLRHRLIEEQVVLPTPPDRFNRGA
jgi:hypothetical protein